MAVGSFESLETSDKSREKKHFVGLDGLRGVAALMVLCVHLVEPYYLHATMDQPLYHAYLAVDFFYVLSGFVIAYAYDDRWQGANPLTVKEFLRRRIIRLQPMAVLGTVIGASLFYFQASPTFPIIQRTPWWKVVVQVILGCLMIPSTRNIDIRGWDETYPLNGPAWTLFYEYIANVLYAVTLRSLPIYKLVLTTGAAGFLVIVMCLNAPSGDGGVAGGWVLEPTHIAIAFTRLLYPFLCGILLCRLRKKSSLWQPKTRHPFIVSVLLLTFILAVPYPGGKIRNGLYEVICILVAFPVIVIIGADTNEQEMEPGSLLYETAKFLGGLSYPLYLSHMPFAYIYMNSINNGLVSRKAKLSVSFVFLITAICSGYLSWKYFDEPVRRLINRR